MNPETDYVRDLLSHMGIKADVLFDSNNQRLIIMETEQYNHRRAWIETWFTLIDQNDQYSYFRERARGTGQTV